MYHLGELTICICNLTLIFEPCGNSYAENHEHPIDIGDIYLTEKFFRGMHHPDSRETAECKCLLYYRICRRYCGLTGNYCSSCCDNKGGPIYNICSDNKNLHKLLHIYPYETNLCTHILSLNS